jgi:hypothetical protein
MYFQTMAVIGVSDIQVRGVGDVFNKGTSFSPEWKDASRDSSQIQAQAQFTGARANIVRTTARKTKEKSSQTRFTSFKMYRNIRTYYII